MPLLDRRTVLTAAGALLAGACTAQPGPENKPTIVPPSPGDPRPGGPADPGATGEARRILAWLTALPQRDSKRVVSGQQVSADSRSDYDQLFRGMAARYGRTPAMIGASFDGYWKHDTVGVLIDHWRAGGLVTMDLHRPNPFLDTVDPESYRIEMSTPKPDVTALLADAPRSPARSRWRDDLERLGDIIQELSEAGVTVIFRPLHEANGMWFWWGQDKTTGTSEVVRLYRDMYAYLTDTRDLHNMLWVYSPARPWDAPRMKYYPGDGFVDIIGPTNYQNEMRLGLDGQPDDISDVLAPRRPLGLLEVGSDEPRDGSWNAAGIIDGIRARYPQVTMFNCWHGWTDAKMALVEVSNTEKLMNDPWVISLENIDWRG